MGNITSNVMKPFSKLGLLGDSDSPSSKKSLEHVVNYIVSKYIRQQNFKDMKELANPEYCNKLIILTAKIIAEYLDNTSIKHLAIKKGIDGKKMSRESVLALDKNDLDKYDVKNPTKKRRLCIGLAKHYVQVANLFAAIATTINPKYDFVDSEGEVQTVGLEEKDEIPDDVDRKISRNNLCSNRVAVLLNNQTIKTLEDDFKNGSVTLNPQFCSFNCSTCPVIKDLADEPGIPELEKLYYDDYDYDTGKFDGMTPKMAELYKKDVDELYRAFTGNEAVPETVTKFSDIKLKDYYNTAQCEDGTFNKPVKGSSINTTFYSYIENIKSMMAETKKFHNELLDILDQLFVFGINPETKDKTIVINPNLTDAILSNLTKKTITIITNLYMSCEVYFTKGIELYTKIAKKQFLITTKHQLDSLNSTLDEVSNTKLPDKEKLEDSNLISEKPLISVSANDKATNLESSAVSLADEASSVLKTTAKNVENELVPIAPTSEAPTTTSPAFGETAPTTKAPEAAFGEPAVGTKAPEAAFGEPAVETKAPEAAFGEPAIVTKAPEAAFGEPAIGTKAPEAAFGEPAIGTKASEAAFGETVPTIKAPEAAFGEPAVGTKAPEAAFGEPAAETTAPEAAFGEPAIVTKAPEAASGEPAPWWC